MWISWFNIQKTHLKLTSSCCVLQQFFKLIVTINLFLQAIIYTACITPHLCFPTLLLRLILNMV